MTYLDHLQELDEISSSLFQLINERISLLEKEQMSVLNEAKEISQRIDEIPENVDITLNYPKKISIEAHRARSTLSLSKASVASESNASETNEIRKRLHSLIDHLQRKALKDGDLQHADQFAMMPKCESIAAEYSLKIREIMDRISTFESVQTREDYLTDETSISEERAFPSLLQGDDTFTYGNDSKISKPRTEFDVGAKLRLPEVIIPNIPTFRPSSSRSSLSKSSSKMSIQEQKKSPSDLKLSIEQNNSSVSSIPVAPPPPPTPSQSFQKIYTNTRATVSLPNIPISTESVSIYTNIRATASLPNIPISTESVSVTPTGDRSQLLEQIRSAGKSMLKPVSNREQKVAKPRNIATPTPDIMAALSEALKLRRRGMLERESNRGRTMSQEQDEWK
ncbi:hypothetical protein MP638_007240 [Amoeboaphelidium occidentale]|nr:hypothetical protein MP638_007240 [Amoeboaphelidium occidentale]